MLEHQKVHPVHHDEAHDENHHRAGDAPATLTDSYHCKLRHGESNEVNQLNKVQ